MAPRRHCWLWWLRAFALAAPTPHAPAALAEGEELATAPATCGAAPLFSECPTNCASLYRFVPYGGNFGDEAGIELVQMAAGEKSMCAAVSPDRPYISGLGSTLMHQLGIGVSTPSQNRTVVVYGTGLPSPSSRGSDEEWAAWKQAGGTFDVRAVRGPLTRRFMQTRGLAPMESLQAAAIGDPGMLVGNAFPSCRRQCAPSKRVCLVPHNNDEAILDRSTPSLGARQRSECGDDEHCTVWDDMGPIHFLKTSLGWREMLEALLPCEFVVSSSLHGIIFAEAFGIPARWLAPKDIPQLEHSSYVTEGWFKYVDYYASTRQEVRERVEARATSYDGDNEWPTGLFEDLGDFRPATTLHEALELRGAPTIPADQHASQLEKLLEAFPKDLTESCPDVSSDCALGGASLGVSRTAPQFAPHQALSEPETDCLVTSADCTGTASLSSEALKPDNRTLVVLLGNARGGEEAWASLYKNLLDPEKADLALAFGDTAQPLGNISLKARAKHVWLFHEPSDWGDLLDAAAEELAVDPQQWRLAMAKWKDSGLYGPAWLKDKPTPGSGAIIFALRHLLLRHAPALDVLKSYDTVVFTRSDFFYLCAGAGTMRLEPDQVPILNLIRNLTLSLTLALTLPSDPH